MISSIGMALRVRARNLRYGFLFVPGLIALGIAGVGVAVVGIEKAAGPNGVAFAFDGDASAARSVLATIATSLITVAGVSFSITVVTLQLVSQQFTPRALRNFLGDLVTQVMAGVFVGVFAYCLAMLSSVRDAPDSGGEGFVPALGVTLAILLAVVALGVLIVFIHHMAQSIQVSHIAAAISDTTVDALDELYPEPFGEPAGDNDAGNLLEDWRSEGEPALVTASRGGFVQSVALDDVPDRLGDDVRYLHVCVAPGDFVGAGEPVAEVWTTGAEGDFDDALEWLVVVGGERDIAQDALYGFRQLADIAMRALSPGVNDPTTAWTCIRYIRSLLVRLADRRFPARVRRYDERDVTVVVERHDYAAYADVGLIEIGRYASRDGRIARALLDSALAAARAAAAAGARERVVTLVVAARTIAEPALADLPSERDRVDVQVRLDELERHLRQEAAA